MLSRRVPLLAAFSAMLLLLSIGLKDWRPSTLIIAIASLLTLTNILASTGHLEVYVRKEIMQDSAEAGETVTVTISITNNGNEKIDFLEIYDALPAELPLSKGSNHLIISLEKGETAKLSYEILCERRGVYEIGPTFLRTRDPFAFSFNEIIKQTTLTLRVLPKIEKIKASDLPFKQTGQWPGVIHSSRRGSGTEFYGLREYVSGDELRRISWKASARMGRLMSIENESERSTNIVIILDASTDLKLPIDSQDTILEYCIRAAGSLAALFLILGNEVSIINHCLNRAWLPGGFGKRQIKRVLDHLATVKAGEPSVPIGFGLERIFKTKPQVIIVSPLLSAKIVDEVKDVLAEGYSLIIISPSLPRFTSKGKGKSDEMASRILILERKNAIAELSGYCTVIDWNPLLPLKAAIKGVKHGAFKMGS